MRAQTGATKRQLPADRVAYAAADELKDPAQRIDAFEKFLRDFPEAPQSHSARRTIFEATLALHARDRNKLMTKAKALLKASEGNDRGRMASAIARQLHEAKLYPADAERFALEAVAAPGSAGRRAAAEDTLGQIYRRAGNTKQAERWLQRALVSDPMLAASATALGEMAGQAGRPADALSYFAQACLARPDARVTAQFEEAWRKAHAGDVAGSEAFLDERYRRLFPSPLRVTPYVQTAARTSRMVLAEVHTGTGCPPCLAADLAIDAALERYSRQELAVVMYHQHIPRPDPLASDATAALFEERRARGVPAVLIDGHSIDGSGLREQAVKISADIQSDIERRLRTAPGVSLKLAAVREGETIRVTARLGEVIEDVRLRLVLVEKMVTYSGESGIRFHPMVARSLHTIAAPGIRVEHAFVLSQVAAQVKDHLDRFERHEENFNSDGKFRFASRKDQINTGGLAVVAYVENNKEILQAAYVDLQP